MSLIRSTCRLLLVVKSHNRLPTAAPTRSVARWVAPTLRELRKRKENLGPEKPQPRSGHVEWNYRAELFAFGKRLNEEFQLPLLQIAFTQRCYVQQEQQRQRELGIEEVNIQIADNENLAKRGENLSKEYIRAYLQHSLPKVPTEGQQAFAANLLSIETLSHVAIHIGMKELLFAAEYPPSEAVLARSLLAVIGALEESTSTQRAFLFVRDFICTQLNQRDLTEWWQIENPEDLLGQICKQRQLSVPEPRLIGDCAKNTVLAAFHVGIYVDKNLIGKGFGEDIPTATKTASLDALLSLCGIQDNMGPFNYRLNVEPNNAKLTQN